MKDTARNALQFLRLDLTKNLEYDRLTKTIIKQTLKPESGSIDVGCHKGEILTNILRSAPRGEHFAFEPIPVFYEQLKNDFNRENIHIYPFALAEKDGHTNFQFVKNAPAYSGIKRRKYDVSKPDIEEIQVEMKRMDDIIPEKANIKLIKIDVEGAEFGVLKGAVNTITRNRPAVIFESGLGASEYYGTRPEELYTFIKGTLKLELSTLKNYATNREPLTIEEFLHLYENNVEYYFIAHPRSNQTPDSSR